MTTHGTATTYVHSRCRCPACTAANARRSAARRQVRFALRVLVDGRMVAPLPAHRHGSVNTYGNWGCRCEACTHAHAKACRDRQRRRAAVAK